MGKHWFLSKTLWVNGLAFLALVIQGVIGRELLDAELQVGILALVNLVLRRFTDKPLGW